MSASPVVVGYHGKKYARDALAWAAREADHRGVPLTVLFAANWPGMTLPSGTEPLAFEPGALEAAEEVTAQGVTEALAVCPRLEVGGMTVVTSPTRALIEASAHAELVVVGSRGRGPVVETLLGSISFSVAARAECPVVVVEQGMGEWTAGPGRPVVAGVDGSPAALQAVAFAADYASGRRARLELICCTGEMLAPGVDPEQVRAGADAALRRARTTARSGRRGLQVLTRRVDGAPEPVLIEASAEAGLMVVGSRGRGAFHGMLAGSVAHAVVHRARCPVAVVGGSGGR
ncbi:universal stress protein [Thermomonospora curvata]|uniref:UspA domain protein n=1 Tax=Thermomonospora curvata (strain ATCC 19995 / DSM 43183 / JCM 3096 / KCTC 9072 / NBRC 15933 / NCIMB 10081 / Henssen B9) TaxID=471852 RepID=D1AF44_THECD|nr:universal stress protein [Thermomonospora curvata]ACY99588.1 UspA domain protein [Thermomonospora curvata DSM 43183]